MTNGGRQAGDEHVAALSSYLAGLSQDGEGVPQRAGKLNFTAVARACGFNREVLYQNPRCKALLAAAMDTLASIEANAAAEPTGASSAAGDAVLERRVGQLERQNAALYAEVHELRRQLKQYETIEAVFVETGRRVIP
jgi:hypothetical protein